MQNHKKVGRNSLDIAVEEYGEETGLTDPSINVGKPRYISEFIVYIIILCILIILILYPIGINYTYLTTS
jgi:hypothetical protein